MKKTIYDFTPETIQQLFGFEDAESESPKRLKEYFLKKDTYDSMFADLPVRILVGHKGTGKSALFRVLMSDEEDRGSLVVMIKPDDIAEICLGQSNFLIRIREWKNGLLRIIAEKALAQFGEADQSIWQAFTNKSLGFLDFLSQSSNKIKEYIDATEVQKKRAERYLKNKRVVVFLDDLDRGWEGRKDDVTRISALLNAVRDLANENDGLRFKIALRSDVYYLARTSDESTDKIEGSVVWCTWTNHEILVMLIKRILTFNHQQVNYSSLLQSDQFHLSTYLDEVFSRKFEGFGRWSNTYTYKVLMSMIRKRPRDLVKLCALAASHAYSAKSHIITTEHLRASFDEYSQGRLQDTINEYRSELPNIQDLLLGMKPTTKEKESKKGFVYTTPELRAKLRTIMQHKRFTLAGQPATENSLMNFLYKINFITARKTVGEEIQRKYFEENRYLTNTSVDFGYDWEVHPAFRWALQPEDPYGIYERLSINSDD